MKTLVSCLVIAGSFFASAAFAACEMPALVDSIPDGATATEEELLVVQVEIEAYVSAMDEYIACQNEEMAENGENASSEYLYLITDRIESARHEVDQIATNFNDQVNAFRAAREVATGSR